MTNPYQAVFDGIRILGHSGQPLADIDRQTASEPAQGSMVIDDGTDVEPSITEENEESSSHLVSTRLISILESTIRWGHISPTSPGILKRPSQIFLDYKAVFRYSSLLSIH